MKLLFDHNLSPRLVPRLADLFPGSEHMHTLVLDRTSDEDVWRYARQHNFVIATKDADFSEMSLLRGFPPKIVWIRIGNCTTQQVEDLLRSHHEEIDRMNDDPECGILSLS